MILKISEAIFLDTAFFKALIDIRDEFHAEAVKIWRKIAKLDVKLVTTNFVLDETFTLIRVKCGLRAVMNFRESLAAGLKRMKIIRVLLCDEEKAWEWFLLNWSDLSFTDCVSFTVMKRLGLTSVATFDNHFQKAGLRIKK